MEIIFQWDYPFLTRHLFKVFIFPFSLQKRWRGGGREVKEGIPGAAEWLVLTLGTIGIG